MKLASYILVAKNTWSEMTTYRMSFLIWRVRLILQLLTLYFLWLAVLPPHAMIATYNQSNMLTYVLATQLVYSFVMSSRSQQIGDDITQGVLMNFLLKPMHYFGFWFARDIGDKLLNIVFSVIELVVFYLLLRPHLFFQTNSIFLLLTVMSIILGILVYFFISVLLGLFGFWSSETWAPRFILFQVIVFLSGGLFPLDILPRSLFLFLRLLPFSYLLYFPIKIYLGQIAFQEIFFGFLISLIWVCLLFFLVKIIWEKGLRVYTAYGR